MSETKGFDWHAEQKADSFLGWLVPSVLGGMREAGSDVFEPVAHASDDFRDVRITMQINGIEVDAMPFIEGVNRNMRYRVGQEALRIVREDTSFGKIEDIIHGLRRQIEGHLFNELDKAGIEIPDQEEW